MNSIDRKIIEHIASEWIADGGDAEGFLWIKDHLYVEIERQEQLLKEQQALSQSEEEG